MNIEIISGSPRTASVTHRLVVFLERYLRERTEHNINVIDVRDWELPLMQQEVYAHEGKAPEALQPLAKRMFEADAFILVSPEYNGSYTSALKNLFDHFPKQTHKVFGVVTASTGALGGMRAAQQMQLLIIALFGIGSPYMLVTPHVDKRFDSEGNLLDTGFQKNIDVFITEFLWLAENLAPEMKSIV
ncbi:MAG TPA: NAD(P)H-dependent oxidoreductase [Chitinophagaceae bacterium]|nr:NAD(P)H-dependent oxidoreductase [Chitinophagaceae bacterium]